jgi:hypothetical protein
MIINKNIALPKAGRCSSGQGALFIHEPSFALVCGYASEQF